jgi:PAS domain S-box-containing protein
VDIRKTGIDILGCAPWSTQLCLFHQTKEDLLDILPPYFKAGLENNEFCILICREPLRAGEAKEALCSAIRNLEDYVAKGQLKIVSCDREQSEGEDSGLAEMRQLWVARARTALERGFAGLRLAGDICWLKKKGRKNLQHYEERDEIVKNRKTLAISYYSLDECTALQIIAIIAAHELVMVRAGDGWELIKCFKYKNALEALSHNEMQFRELIERIPKKIFIKDYNSVYLFCNQNYARDLKIKPAEIIGKTDYDFFPRKLAQKYRNDDKRIIEKGETEDIEQRYIEGGREKWVHAIKAPYKNAQGNAMGVLGIFRDITDRKRMEEELRKEKLALEQKNLALAELLDHMERVKDKLKEDITLNVEGLVMPVLEKLKSEGSLAERSA